MAHQSNQIDLKAKLLAHEARLNEQAKQLNDYACIAEAEFPRLANELLEMMRTALQGIDTVNLAVSNSSEQVACNGRVKLVAPEWTIKHMYREITISATVDETYSANFLNTMDPMRPFLVLGRFRVHPKSQKKRDTLMFMVWSEQDSCKWQLATKNSQNEPRPLTSFDVESTLVNYLTGSDFAAREETNDTMPF